MKAFNLEDFKAGVTGITRAGDEVTFLAYAPEAQEFYRLVYLDSRGYVDQCREDGCYLESGESRCDIVGLKPKTVVVWLNLYPEASLNYKRAYGYASREYAEEGAGSCRINGKSYRVEIEL